MPSIVKISGVAEIACLRMVPKKAVFLCLALRENRPKIVRSSFNGGKKRRWCRAAADVADIAAIEEMRSRK